MYCTASSNKCVSMCKLAPVKIYEEQTHIQQAALPNAWRKFRWRRRM